MFVSSIRVCEQTCGCSFCAVYIDINLNHFKYGWRIHRKILCQLLSKDKGETITGDWDRQVNIWTTILHEWCAKLEWAKTESTNKRLSNNLAGDAVCVVIAAFLKWTNYRYLGWNLILLRTNNAWKKWLIKINAYCIFKSGANSRGHNNSFDNVNFLLSIGAGVLDDWLFSDWPTNYSIYI